MVHKNEITQAQIRNFILFLIFIFDKVFLIFITNFFKRTFIFTTLLRIIVISLYFMKDSVIGCS